MKSSKESSLEPQCDKFDKFHKSMKPSNGRTSISKTIRKCIRVSIKDFLNEAKTVYVYSSPAPNSGVATPGLGHVIPAGSLPWSSLLRFLALDSEVRNLHLAPIGELPHNFDCIVAALGAKCYAIYVCQRMARVNFYPINV